MFDFDVITGPGAQLAEKSSERREPADAKTAKPEAKTPPRAESGRDGQPG